jgi:hypothetical protein
MSLRERIERIYQHSPHPLGALWAWAKRGGDKAGERWQALQNWAGDRLRGGNKSADFEKARDAYQAKKQKWLHNHKDPKPPSGELLTTYDGHQVPSWMVQRPSPPPAPRASGRASSTPAIAHPSIRDSSARTCAERPRVRAAVPARAPTTPARRPTPARPTRARWT